MDYLRRHAIIHLALFYTFIEVTSSSDARLQRLLNENFPENILPHHWKPGEIEQMTCDFESPCSWTMSNHSSRGDWRVLTPDQFVADMRVAKPPTDHSARSSNGHFLLLTATAAVSKGSCKFFIASPVLWNSGPQCRLQVAQYHTQDVLGNLTVLVQSADSSIILQDLGDSWQEKNREQWDVFQIRIGQHKKPFVVMLLYSTCGLEDWGTLALDSLQLKDCDKGDIMVDCVDGLSFHCDLGVCIDKSRVCDFNNDCPLGEDEGHVCGEWKWLCGCERIVHSKGFKVCPQLEVPLIV